MNELFFFLCDLFKLYSRIFQLYRMAVVNPEKKPCDQQQVVDRPSHLRSVTKPP